MNQAAPEITHVPDYLTFASSVRDLSLEPPLETAGSTAPEGLQTATTIRGVRVTTAVLPIDCVPSPTKKELEELATAKARSLQDIKRNKALQRRSALRASAARAAARAAPRPPSPPIRKDYGNGYEETWGEYAHGCSRKNAPAVLPLPDIVIVSTDSSDNACPSPPKKKAKKSRGPKK